MNARTAGVGVVGGGVREQGRQTLAEMMGKRGRMAKKHGGRERRRKGSL